MPLRVPIAMLLLSLVAATAYETAERKSAPPSVCFQPLEDGEAPRCTLPPAEGERAS
jgi:hypothetical protein